RFECQLQQLFGRIKGESGVGAKLHGDRRDPGSYGGPRRLSTPKLTDFHQIRLGSRIHAADTPHSDTTPPLTDSSCLVDPRHAWMILQTNRIFRIEFEEHPRMVWINDRSRKSVEGGVGPGAGA
ncbi:hypothetical protein, partial [Stenotrophomonas sepilia]|uniref:hypothetical protein n=1 Tax=Stenotrophomonas sepilia TaxID=2860290 RepID=UPI002E79C75A